MTPDVPVDPPKLPKGKRQERPGGGGTSDPGQAPPPGAWPGSFPDDDDPAQALAVVAPEWLTCLRELVQTGVPIPARLVAWLLLLAEPHTACLRERAAVAAAVEAFAAAMEPHERPRLEVVSP